MKIEDVEKAIKIPASKWPGNCDTIAHAMLAAGLVPGGVSRYGHFLGKVHPRSIFYETWLLSGFSRHGWIECDGLVYDPTRWVFECSDPYIYIGPKTAEYDVGGNLLRGLLRGPFPKNTRDHPQIKLFSELDSTTGEWLWTYVAEQKQRFDRNTALSIDQVCWFANLSPDELGPLAKPLYSALEKLGLDAMIPIDNKRLVG